MQTYYLHPVNESRTHTSAIHIYAMVGKKNLQLDEIHIHCAARDKCTRLREGVGEGKKNMQRNEGANEN